MNAQLTLPDTRGMRPRRSGDLMVDALEWIDANRSAWMDIARAAHTDAVTIKRVRVKRYLEDMRVSPKVASAGPVKLPNAFSAPFGRILRAWYPDLAEYIPLGHSKTDGCSIPPRPTWAALRWQ